MMHHPHPHPHSRDLQPMRITFIFVLLSIIIITALHTRFSTILYHITNNKKGDNNNDNTKNKTDIKVYGQQYQPRKVMAKVCVFYHTFDGISSSIAMPIIHSLATCLSSKSFEFYNYSTTTTDTDEKIKYSKLFIVDNNYNSTNTIFDCNQSIAITCMSTMRRRLWTMATNHNKYTSDSMNTSSTTDIQSDATDWLVQNGRRTMKLLHEQFQTRNESDNNQFDFIIMDDKSMMVHVEQILNALHCSNVVVAQFKTNYSSYMSRDASAPSHAIGNVAHRVLSEIIAAEHGEWVYNNLSHVSVDANQQGLNRIYKLFI